MRYWRVRFTASAGGPDSCIYFNEIVFRNRDGDDISAGGAPFSNSEEEGCEKEYAFDKTSIGWGSRYGEFPVWIGCELAQPQLVDSIQIQLSGYEAEHPVSGHVHVEHSADGVEWITAVYFAQSVDFTDHALVALSDFRFTQNTPLRTASVLAHKYLYEADPYLEKVELLLHMEGANGSTTFIDDSPRKKTMSNAGGVVVSTADSRFGGSSAFISSSNKAVYTKSSGLDLEDSDFCLELFFRPDVAGLPPSGGSRVLLAKDWGGTKGRSYYLYLYEKNGSYVVRFAASPDGVNSYWYVETAPIDVTKWSHVAVTRDGNFLNIFLDGFFQHWSYFYGKINTSATASFGVGAQVSSAGVAANAFRGYIDEVRVTKGVARYKATYRGSFLPPREPFYSDIFAASVAASTPLGVAAIMGRTPTLMHVSADAPLAPAAGLVLNMSMDTLGRTTVFGMPGLVTINSIEDGFQFESSIPAPMAVKGMPPGKMVTQASPLPPPVFGKPSVQFATNHPVVSLEGMVVFGTFAARSIHTAESLEPVQFSAMGAPVSTAHAASVQDGTQFGQPLASTLHALPDWYAGLLIGCAAAQSTGVFPVLDGVQLGGFGHPSLGATRHPAASVHMLPSFGQIAISFGDSTC